MSSGREQRRAALLVRFREIAAERIQRIGSGWVRLEQSPDDAEEAVEVLRELHTLKGEARAVGFGRASELVHDLETLVLGARARRFAVSPEDATLVLAAADTLASMVRAAPEDPVDPSVDALTSQIRTASSALEALAPGESAAHALESGAPLGAQGDHAQGDAPVGAVSPHSPSRVAETSGPASEPGERPDLEARGAAIRAQAPRARPVRAGEGTLRVRTSRVEALSDVGAELLTVQSRNAFRVQQLLASTRRLEHVTDAPGQRAVHEQVRELSRMVVQLEEELYRQQLQTQALDRTVRELRLVPAGPLLVPYERMVRDLAKEGGKEAWLQLSGTEVEADRRVLEQLEEPLLHLLRNCVDHGIETPALREARGKPARGTIQLTLQTGGGVLRVVVQDDGAGLSPELLRQRAVEKGLLNVSVASTLSPDQCLQLVFLPGFSTRDTATELSGRGVGMDVVKQRVEGLGGRVHLSGSPGRGIRVELVVPITLSLTRALVVKAGPYLCALPAVNLVSVQRLVDLERMETPEGPAVKWEDAVLPLLTLEEALTRGGEPAVGLPVVLLLRAGSSRCALLVAEPGFEADVLVRRLGPPLGSTRVLAGAAQLSDGALALVPRAAELIARAHRRRNVEGDQRLQRPSEQRLLVVDDSVILRASLVSMVKSLGYQVLTAGDGLEALAVLEESSVDLVVTDLQMPRLDGFGLLRRLRANPRWRTLPTLVLSSLGSAQDRLTASEAGANAHLNKSELTESTLAEAIHRLLG